MNITRTMIFCAAILLSSTHHALATPMMTFSGGFGIGQVEDTVGGWEFEVTSSIQVDGLGFWDSDSNGLDRAHDVGLWTLSGDLLASGTVDNAATAEANGAGPGRWLFTSITPLTLNPGNYVLGALFVDQYSDLPIVFGTPLPIAGVNFVSGRSREATTLAFPDMQPSGPFAPSQFGGVFGPNLRLAEAPVPGTLPILSLGLAALGLHRRRQSRCKFR